MTTPVSSTPRGTAPTSSDASSPLTASVIKFRCLYTHDLRRKSKRWHDGYLRYHAFNKRVMVYDETGNYIGDHHWRASDEVQDGDEMELDKGALIQVGERMGMTQTDISNLFEKRMSSQGSPQAKDTASQTPRVPAPIRSSGSSQPFRSLSDLLGIKKTQIGHLVSPYEERHPPPSAANIPESSERAPKRQKVSSHKASPLEKASMSKQNTQIVDLTEEEDLRPMTKAPDDSRGPEAPRKTQQAAAPPKKDLGQNRRASPVNRSGNISLTSKPVNSQLATSNKPTTTTPETSRGHPPKVVPPAGSNEKRNEQLEARKGAATAAKPTSRLSQQAARHSQDLGQNTQTPLVNASGKAPNQTTRTRPDPPTFVKPALPPSLESSRRPHKPSPPALTNVGRREPSEARKLASAAVPSKDKSTPDISSKAPVNTLRISTEKPRRKLMYSALLPRDALQRSAAGLPSSSPASRGQPLKSELSQTNMIPLHEIDSTNIEFMPSDSTQFILEEMIAAPALNLGAGNVRKPINLTSTQEPPSLPQKLRVKRALDVPFRKSISDPSALMAVQTRPTLTRSALSAVPEQHHPIEEGPWTSEALDLFDFWPPGRLKPTAGD